jgi:hypothetical protein
VGQGKNQTDLAADQVIFKAGVSMNAGFVFVKRRTEPAFWV